LSIISAGDLQFVSIHFSKSEMLTPCSTAGRWTRTVIVCLVAQSFDNVGAWIVGRNIFGPVRGPWKDESWKGWWGNNPPFHSPVFVLKHHARSPLSMEGGTTFYFVTNGPEAALKLAQEAAEDKEVRVGGGVSVIRQYLATDQINELHLAISPVVLGEGEHLLEGISLALSRAKAAKPLTSTVLVARFPA
jgi:dihydrofolate reductase